MTPYVAQAASKARKRGPEDDSNARVVLYCMAFCVLFAAILYVVDKVVPR